SRSNPRAPALDPVFSDGIAAIRGRSLRRGEFEAEEIAPGLAHGGSLEASISVGKQAQAGAVRVLMHDDVGCVRAVGKVTCRGAERGKQGNHRSSAVSQ